MEISSKNIVNLRPPVGPNFLPPLFSNDSSNDICTFFGREKKKEKKEKKKKKKKKKKVNIKYFTTVFIKKKINKINKSPSQQTHINHLC